MTWNLTTLTAFFESQKHNPYEYNRLCTADPIGRLWSAYMAAIEAFNAAKHEHQGLGVGAISSDSTRTTALEGIMTAALARRDIMEAGIVEACGDLGSAEEPTTRYLQRRPGEAALIAALEAVAVGCGV